VTLHGLGPIVTAAAGAALLAAAALAGPGAPEAPAAGMAKGGTLRIDLPVDLDYIDPALGYSIGSWQLGDATNLKLYSYPDVEGQAGNRIVPEAAIGMPTVSKDGRTYTIRVKRGFRFANGAPVTASSFALMLHRNLDPRMQSPAGTLLSDLVGSQAYRDGAAPRISGVRVRGDRLKVSLTRVAPDFLARLTTNFMAAVPAGTPVDKAGIDAPFYSAGPYYVKERVKGRRLLVVRNPYWRNDREPWRSLNRPANVDAIAYTIGNAGTAIRLRIDHDDTDLGMVPASAWAELVDRHGINRERVFVRKEQTTWWVQMNTASALFRDNPRLRRAVGWALDRPHLARQHGYLAGARTDQILPPGMPGYRDWQLYPLGGASEASLAKARQLARGNLRAGKAVLYAFGIGQSPAVAQVVAFNLRQIGLDVRIELFSPPVVQEKVGTRGEPFDLAILGWAADYADPSTFLNTLFDGDKIQDRNNANSSYLDDPNFNRRLHEAYRLSGEARYDAYAALDRDLSRDAAPVAAYLTANARVYVSQSVGCFSFQPARGLVNLTALCKR
jgi:peptide/nickel transport system substrate-binding protein